MAAEADKKAVDAKAVAEVVSAVAGASYHLTSTHMGKTTHSVLRFTADASDAAKLTGAQYDDAQDLKAVAAMAAASRSGPASVVRNAHSAALEVHIAVGTYTIGSPVAMLLNGAVHRIGPMTARATKLDA